MRIRPQSAKRFDEVYYDENNGLVLYTNPGIDHNVLSSFFNSYKDQSRRLLNSLIKYLENKFDELSKGIISWSKIEKNHPANRLLNLITFW